RCQSRSARVSHLARDVTHGAEPARSRRVHRGAAVARCRSVHEDTSSSPRSDEPLTPDPERTPPADEPASQAPPPSAAPRSPAGPRDHPHSHHHLDHRAMPRSRTPLAAASLGALGVVFGDIGTSPLYALQTVFSLHHHAVAPTEADVLGVISMVVWCLLIIVTFAYIGLIMRADNQGEGGILALTALVLRKLHGPGGVGPREASVALVLGVIGAALFFGDSVITPAISVLSAFEGIEVAAAVPNAVIVPGALIVLTALFAVQHRG